jgi:hypothetical protein
MKSTKTLFKTTILVGSIWATMASCSKDRIEARDELNSYESPNTYLDSKKQPEQEFIIDSAGTGPIVGNQNTHIWGSKDCLMLPNGDSVSYPFTVKLVELYTPKDMIYYRMPTVSASRILETGGEIRLRAFKNSTEAKLRPGCEFKVSMPNEAPLPDYMRVFYGFESGSIIDWTDDLASLGVTQQQNPVWELDTIGYTALIERLGWINCDRLAGSTTGSTLTFASEEDDLTNVAIFVYLPATKTVMQAYNQSVGIIPNGTAAKVIAIALNSAGTLFSFSQDLTVNGSQTIQVTMSATTDAALTTLLDGL